MPIPYLAAQLASCREFDALHLTFVASFIQKHRETVLPKIEKVFSSHRRIGYQNHIKQLFWLRATPADIDHFVRELIAWLMKLTYPLILSVTEIHVSGRLCQDT